MKAVILNRYGDSSVLEYVNDLTVPPCDSNQVLIKVKAAGVNPLDWKIRQGQLRLLLRSSFPIVLGNDVCGTIVEVGNQVKNFSVGNDVYCMIDSNKKKAFHGFAKSGGYAEYAVTTEDTLCRAPNNLSPVESAAIPLAALTAYQALVKKGKLKAGHRVLINGASGGVGSFAVQIAKSLNAEITAVGKDGDLLRSLGADHTIDYRKVDFAKGKDNFDIIYDVACNRTFAECYKVLTPNGVFVSNIASLNTALFPLVQPVLQLFGFRKRYTYNWVHSSGEDLSVIRDMVESNEIKPVIGSVYQLKDAKLAHDRGEANNARGKTVLVL